MPNIRAKDADNSTIELLAKGLGTPNDPFYYGAENTSSIAWKAKATGNGYEIGEILFLKKQ